MLYIEGLQTLDEKEITVEIVDFISLSSWFLKENTKK